MRSGAKPSRRSPDAEPPVAHDQAVIDAMVARDLEQLRTLSPQVGDVTALLARARRLGLTATLIKKAQTHETPLFVRVCLKCDARFVSVGRQNRLCRPCAKKQ